MSTDINKATPRPWTYHANYIEVSNEHGDHSLYAPDDRGAVSPETRWANARFVVKAVNLHDDLVAVLRVCEQDLSDIVNAADNGEPYSLDELVKFKGNAMAHAALAKAEEA